MKGLLVACVFSALLLCGSCKPAEPKDEKAFMLGIQNSLSDALAGFVKDEPAKDSVAQVNGDNSELAVELMKSFAADGERN